MGRKYLPVFILFLSLYACHANDEKKKAHKPNEHQSESVEEQANLINLDTAKHLFNILCQGWVMADDAESLEGMTESSQMEIPYRSFYFSSNGTFIKNPRNNFDYGNWSLQEGAKKITVTSTIEKSTEVYTIVQASPVALSIVSDRDKSGTVLKFIAPGKRYADPQKEPYFLENNRWRIKPKAAESDSAIHRRLKENIRFFILFYRSALEKNEKAVSFWGLPSCFKWYGGGIFIKKKEELKNNWIACFYNNEQAMQAYALADKLLSEKYDWPKGEQNWLKLNLAIVEMMYAKLDKIH